MTPRPEQKGRERCVETAGSVGYGRPAAGDEVVISGISGKFPDSDSVRDFCDNLYNKVDMISGDDRRWKVDHPEIPNRTGRVNGMEKFDAQFFGVHYKQAWTMDPMCRMILESTYEAIIDAGINPRDLRGTNTAVFIGVSTSDSEKTWYYEKTQINGFGLTGSARSMLSNRISYWLGATGPSYTLNSNCSSTLQALEQAYTAISSGQCSAAIVGGANFCTHPFISLQYFRMGLLSNDSVTRSFDKNASGSGRGEAINIILLQKAKDSKRVYAQVVHAKSNCDGLNSKNVTKYADKESQRNFLESFYSEIDILPSEVKYIEAFGSGIPELDKHELDAIDEVFCKGRQDKILVGSVKSNMGNAEAVSGAAATTKICLAYHRGAIAPNLHYSEPRDDVAGVREGRIQVVTETTPFSGGYTAASSFSYSGDNVHVLFKDYTRPKYIKILDELPRLVMASGRSEDGMKKIFDDIESLPLDMEQIRLIQNIHEKPIPGHVFRSFNVLKMRDGKTVSLSKSVDYFSGVKRPVWFVYSGMGSQWSGMGTQLMRLPVFAAAIERCCQTLAPKGIDLMRILTDPDPSMYDNILHSFVGIAAVQIGLTDVLTALGIYPDNIIGHSVGELGCAYADGCFTAEEMILAAYSRGLVSVQTPFIRGSMAAVGIGYDKIKNICPWDIEVACHNSSESCTISGPVDAMKKFVGELTAKGVFAREVPCSNIAYHSRYIAEAGPGLLEYLRQVIKNPKPRSSRWLSTSVPQLQWDQPCAQLSSAEYHTNNLLNPVLFEETSRQIPPNAIAIEVAPHGLLQAILRRSLAADTINVPLTKRSHPNNVEFFLEAVGKLFMAGLNPKMANIYPCIEFPVPARTSLLSHFVDWEHSENWFNHLYYPKMRVKSGIRHFIMSTCDEEYRFMSGCIIDGLNVFPAAGCLLLAWETLAMTLGVLYTDLSVVFENIYFQSDAVIHKGSILELVIMVQKVTGNFEISSERGVVASGRVYTVKSSKLVNRVIDDHEEKEECNDEHPTLSQNDVYNVLLSKGYSYRGAFRSIQSSNFNANKGKIKFDNNWVTFLEAMLQMNLLQTTTTTTEILKPKFIQKLTINAKVHRRITESRKEDDPCLDVAVHELYNVTRCGGVEFEGLVMKECLRFVPQAVVAEAYTFAPFFGTEVLETIEGLRVNIQVALQNNVLDEFKVVEIFDEGHKDLKLAIEIKNILEDNKTFKHNIQCIKELDKNIDTFFDDTKLILAANLVVLSNLLNRRNVMEKLHACLGEESLVLSREKLIPKENFSCEKFHIVAATRTKGDCLVLMKKRKSDVSTKRTKYITVKSNTKFSWVELVQAEWASCDKLVLVSECDPCSGLLGLFNCLRQEPKGYVLILLIVNDYNAPVFKPDLPLYQDQLNKGLALNIYQNGKWGSYHYVPLKPLSVEAEHVYLARQNPDDISSLVWLEGPPSKSSSQIDDRFKKTVQVYYSALTLQDIEKAYGKIQLEDCEDVCRSNDGYGMDFCGRTATDVRVMGLLQAGALSSSVEADVDMLWPVPSHWTMEDAVTVPQAYANAFYCLDIQGSLKPGMSVLIHSGTGALGQAAINICLAHGCEVFTTVSTQQKKKWLLKIFPALKEDHIGNSRTEDFEDMVMSSTADGCHIVLNTLSGNLCKGSLRCVGKLGIFVNVNKDDAMSNSPFGMSFLDFERKYIQASMQNLFRQSEGARRKRVQLLMADGISKGFVQPLSRIVFGMSDTRKAFRFMSRGHHIGKVLLKMRDEELKPVVTPSHKLFTAQPRFFCSEGASYVVIAGNIQSGSKLAEWLVERGAKILVLHTQDTASSGYQAAMIRSWRLSGVKVHCSSESLQTLAGCLQLLTDANKQGPVLGVFIAPHTAEQRAFENAKPEHFAKAFSDKAVIVMNLDSATRKLCSGLKHFVVLSSTAAGRGAAGCSSGSLADSAVERVCENRGKIGLPALALQLEEVDEFESNDEALSTGKGISRTGRLSVMLNLNEFDQLLKWKNPVAALSPYSLRSKIRPGMSVLQDLAEYIEDFKDLPEEYTIEKLGVDLPAATEIQLILEKNGLNYTPAKILKLTISELKAMQSQQREVPADDTGLGIFYTYVDSEEFNAGDSLVRMPTLLSDGFETEEELYKKDTYLILIPGMEGHKDIFSTISKRLKVNAFACQLESDNFTESIVDMAKKISQIIVKKIRPEKEFFILGYSFGVTVALEVAANLEMQGYVGKVFCLDGGPAWFAALLDAQLGYLSEPQLQDAVTRHMFRVMCGDAAAEAEPALLRALAAESDWERKLDACMRHLRGRVPFSFQYQRAVVAMAYARIRQARAYSDERLRARPLRSELVLLKATRAPAAATAAVPADYGLAAYSQQPLALYELDCDHAAAPADLNVSDILNRHVADIDRFKRLNLCDTYVINPFV